MGTNARQYGYGDSTPWQYAVWRLAKVVAGIEFDTIAVSGSSGRYGAALAAHIEPVTGSTQPDLGLLWVRKPEERTVPRFRGSVELPVPEMTGWMGERVLIVDDEINSGSTVARILSAIGRNADRWIDPYYDECDDWYERPDCSPSEFVGAVFVNPPTSGCPAHERLGELDKEAGRGARFWTPDELAGLPALANCSMRWSR